MVFQPKLPPSSEKPIVLGSGEKKDDPKPTQISKPAETAEPAEGVDALVEDEAA